MNTSNLSKMNVASPSTIMSSCNKQSKQSKQKQVKQMKQMKSAAEDNEEKQQSQALEGLLGLSSSSLKSATSTATSTDNKKKTVKKRKTKKTSQGPSKRARKTAASPTPSSSSSSSTLSSSSSTLSSSSSAADAHATKTKQKTDEGVADPTDNDVLCGRGGKIPFHSGNRHFRELVAKYRSAYLRARKNEKPEISRGIVRLIQSTGGRFLKQNAQSGLWHEISDAAALDKTSQQMRTVFRDEIDECKRFKAKMEMAHGGQVNGKYPRNGQAPSHHDITHSMLREIQEATAITNASKIRSKIRSNIRSNSDASLGGGSNHSATASVSNHRSRSVSMSSYAMINSASQLQKALASHPQMQAAPQAAAATITAPISMPMVLSATNNTNVTMQAQMQQQALAQANDVTTFSDAEDIKPVPASTDGIAHYTSDDILCGRGGAMTKHPGNQKYRRLIDQFRTVYFKAKKKDKPMVSRKVVRIIRSQGGRFLKQKEDALWYEVGDHIAFEKTSQQIRDKDELQKLVAKQLHDAQETTQLMIATQRQMQQAQQREQYIRQQAAIVAAHQRLASEEVATLELANALSAAAPGAMNTGSQLLQSLPRRVSLLSTTDLRRSSDTLTRHRHSLQSLDSMDRRFSVGPPNAVPSALSLSTAAADAAIARALLARQHPELARSGAFL